MMVFENHPALIEQLENLSRAGPGRDFVHAGLDTRLMAVYVPR
jgi:hypothetical protein